MPKAGVTINLTDENFPIYKQIIKRYEGKEMGDNTTFQKIKDEINPIEAGLKWVIDLSKKDFLGKTKKTKK